MSEVSFFYHFSEHFHLEIASLNPLKNNSEKTELKNAEVAHKVTRVFFLKLSSLYLQTAIRDRFG